jgi:hypothetical protein
MPQGRGDERVQVGGRRQLARQHPSAALLDRAAQRGRIHPVDGEPFEIGAQVIGCRHGGPLELRHHLAAHGVDVGIGAEPHRRAARQVDPPERHPAAEGPHRPAHQPAQPHLGLGGPRQLPGEHVLLRDPVVGDGDREQGAGPAGLLQAAEQAALGREELARAAPGPLDEELEGLPGGDHVAHPPRQLLVLAARPARQVEGVHRVEQAPQQRDATELGGRGDVGNGNPQIRPGEEQVRAQHEIEVAAMGGHDRERRLRGRGPERRLERRDVRIGISIGPPKVRLGA